MKRTGKIILIGTAAALIVTGGFAVAQNAGERHHRGEMHQAHFKGGERGEGMGRGGRQMLRQMFEAHDLNGDGSLTQEEIDQARAERLASADANGDGALSLEEYEALWLEAMRERMVDAFQRHDADGDGIVTAEEFNERFEGLVAKMDRNGDGVLNSDDRRRGRNAE